MNRTPAKYHSQTSLIKYHTSKLWRESFQRLFCTSLLTQKVKECLDCGLRQPPKPKTMKYYCKITKIFVWRQIFYSIINESKWLLEIEGNTIPFNEPKQSCRWVVECIPYRWIEFRPLVCSSQSYSNQTQPFSPNVCLLCSGKRLP
jgi:hypothetical protein